MEANLLDRMLNMYLADRTLITITLRNKIRVSGHIRAFDSYIIVVDGQKRGIVYRHAVSGLAACSEEMHKMPEFSEKKAPVNIPPRTSKQSVPKPRRQSPQVVLSASTGEPGINNSMKEGLLKWMKEQKAAK